MTLQRKPTQYWALAAVLVVATLLGTGIYTGVLPNSVQTPGSDNAQQLQGMRSASTTSALQTLQSTSVTSTQQTLSAQPLVLGLHPSTLIVQLTDPPVVPTGTTSLNLTYSAINLVVAVPASQNGQVTPQTVAVTPQGGSATLDLFKLQNVSQTIASANLPNGTTIYSLSFTVTGLSIDINGTVSAVTLATGASALQVTLAKSSPLNGTNALLVQLSPTVVDTPTGYQMIPSAVGILRVHSNVGGQNNNDVGSKQPITTKDKDDLDQAKGKVTATLLALTVSGNSTTLTVRVNNTGGSPVKLVAVGLSGSFTPVGPYCTTLTTQTTASSTGTKTTTTSTGSSSATSTKTTTTSTSGEHHTTTTTTSATSSTSKQGDADQNSNSTTTTKFTSTMPPTTTLTSTVTSTTTSPTTTTTTSTHSSTTAYTYTTTSSTKTTTTSTSSEHHSSSYTTTTTYTRTTTSYTYSTSKDNGNHDGQHNDGQTNSVYCKGMGGLVLVPLMAQPTTATTSAPSSTSSSSSATTTKTSTTTSTTSAVAKTCSASKMVPVYGDQKTSDENGGNVLGAGQCVDLTFTGPITFTYGHYSITIIPSTAAGQTYVLGVLGSSEAVMMSCKLPVTSTSCTEVMPHD